MSRTPKQRLYNERQLELSGEFRRSLLSWIALFEDEHKYAPSISELCQEFQRTRSTIWHHLLVLRSAGLVDWRDGQSRTLHVVQH